MCILDEILEYKRTLGKTKKTWIRYRHELIMHRHQFVNWKKGSVLSQKMLMMGKWVQGEKEVYTIFAISFVNPKLF